MKKERNKEEDTFIKITITAKWLDYGVFTKIGVKIHFKKITIE